MTYRKAADGSLSFEGADFDGGRFTAGQVIYHITDHLGSVVGIVRSGSSSPFEYDVYDAYGSRTRNQLAAPFTPEASLRFGFTGKEDQSVELGVPYTDFGARHYSPALTRWLTPDPLSEKYYGRSPYAYCNGDPVNLVDPNGKKVRLAKGSSKEFRSSYTKTVSHMRKMGVTKRLDQLYMSTKEYTIQEAQFPDKSHFDSKTNTVYWDFKHAYRFANGLESSPTDALIHEIIHASRTDEALSDPEKKQAYEERLQTKDEAFKNLEEKEVVKEETEAARALGELGPNQVARTDHREATRLSYDYSQHDPEEVSNAIGEHNKQFE